MLLGKKCHASCLLLLLLGLTSCCNVPGGTAQKTAASGFVAKREYAVSYDKMWNTVRDVLDSERVPITTTDKEEGRITTDFVMGEQNMKVTLLGPIAHTTRHKFSIGLNKMTSSIRLNIIATVEIQEVGHGGGWRPLEEPERTKAVENWLYEKIENALATN